MLKKAGNTGRKGLLGRRFFRFFRFFLPCSAFSIQHSSFSIFFEVSHAHDSE
jgi:hypothetical protein